MATDLPSAARHLPTTDTDRGHDVELENEIEYESKSPLFDADLQLIVVSTSPAPSIIIFFNMKSFLYRTA